MDEDQLARRPVPLSAAVVVGIVEVVALLGYCIAIAITAAGAADDLAAAPALIVVYAAFAVGIAIIVKGLLSRRRIARVPFALTQVFALIVGWTLTQSAGIAVHLAGYAVLAIGVVGIALILNPAVGQSLSD